MSATRDNSSASPEASGPLGSPSPASPSISPPPSDHFRALGDLACSIGNQMQCDVCSIYRLDRQGQMLILAATVGLRQDCIERLQMHITEGLCGLVVEECQPVNIAAQAGEHPRFRFFPEAGEDRLDSFLGVPVLEGADVIGVLVVQTIEPRKFTDSQIRELTQAGREMGPLLQQLRQQKD